MFDGTLVGVSDERKAELERKYGKNFTSISIPLFNRGRHAFEGQAVQENIKKMLHAADFVTVTTDHIKEVYHDLYDIPLEKIIALPNFLPKFLFFDRYRPDDKVAQFKANKAKPRIGIVSSLSHYNIDGVRQDKDGRACRKRVNPDNSVTWVTEGNKEIPESETSEIYDDVDGILDCIRSTADDFQWVFFGYCPAKLSDLVDAKKIEVHGGVQIQNYASAFDNLKLQAVVAAINKTEFNYCKSFIKTMECAALGVPCFATNCLPYSRVMEPAQLFDSSADLKNKLMRLKFASAGVYRNIIDRQWKWLNSEHDEGDFHVKSFWQEDNLKIWLDMFKPRQKGLMVFLDAFTKQYASRKAKEKENTLFKNENVWIMK